MRFLRVLGILLVCFFVTSCACRTKRVGSADNIPIAGEGDILKDVHFAFDSYGLDSMAKGVLSSNASWLKENPSAKVQIEGHCDERGTNEYNMALGAKRAKAAFDYMRTMGVSTDRMSTVSYGEELPLDPRHNEEAWAKNRRAHFNVRQ